MVHISFADPTFIKMMRGECNKGKVGQPTADEIIFRWAVHGDKNGLHHDYSVQTTNDDHEKLHTLDIL